MGADNRMIYVTLNTGHAIDSPRSEVTDGAIDFLRPIISRGGGALPSPLESYLLTVVHEPGTPIWSFDVASDDGPLIYGVVCGDGAHASRAWNFARDLYLSVSRSFRSRLGNTDISGLPAFPAGVMPSSTPWLASVVIPAPVPPAVWMMLGDLARCVAWTALSQPR